MVELEEKNFYRYCVDDAAAASAKLLVSKLKDLVKATDCQLAAEKLKSLDKLFLEKATLEDIRPLNGLYSLKELHLGQNQIKDLAIVERLPELRVVDVYDNLIEDINALAKLKDLEQVYLNKNPVKSLAPLKFLAHLQEIDVRQTPLTTPLREGGLAKDDTNCPKDAAARIVRQFCTN